MKTIIVLLLVIFAMPKIKAQDWTSILPNEENIKIIKSEDRYRWYKEKQVNEKYIVDAKHNCEYFDLSDYIYSEPSIWSAEKPSEEETRIIEEKENIVKLNNKFNKVILNNFDTSSMNLKEIYVINGVTNEIISHNALSSVDLINSEYLSDNDLNTSININANTNVVLSLDETIDAENITVMLLFDKTNQIKSWKTTYLLGEYELKSVISYTKELTRMNFRDYSSYKISLKYIWNITDEHKETLYRYKDKMFKCFNYEREYLTDYYKEADNYIKDESPKLTFYKYEIIGNKTIVNNNIQTKESVRPNIKEAEIIGAINDEEELVAINYGSKKVTKSYKYAPIFIVALGIILITLVFICRKLRLNIENNR